MQRIESSSQVHGFANPYGGTAFARFWIIVAPSMMEIATEHVTIPKYEQGSDDMLIAASHALGATLQHGDEELGTIDDFYFSDDTWRVRYLVVNTGGWLAGRRVLLSPEIINQRAWPSRRLETDRTREQVENSPSVSHELPVSRQNEVALADYYQWSYYWTPMEPLGSGPLIEPTSLPEEPRPTMDDVASGDPNLRSVEEVRDYRIEATDGKIGHVEDIILDDEPSEQSSWDIPYFVVETKNWLPGRKVLVSPRWAESIDHIERTVALDMTREKVKNSPRFDPESPINHQYEEVLCDYYGQPRRWLARSEAGRSKE